MPANPVPTALKILRGTDQPCRINANEPKPKADKVRAPTHMSKEAKAIWRKVEPILTGCKVLTNADVDCLMMYCNALVLYKEATVKLVDDPVYKHNGMLKVSPWQRIQKEQYTIWMACAKELGLTPAARTKVETHTPDDKKDESGFSSL